MFYRVSDIKFNGQDFTEARIQMSVPADYSEMQKWLYEYNLPDNGKQAAYKAYVRTKLLYFSYNLTFNYEKLDTGNFNVDTYEYLPDLVDGSPYKDYRTVGIDIKVPPVVVVDTKREFMTLEDCQGDEQLYVYDILLGQLPIYLEIWNPL